MRFQDLTAPVKVAVTVVVMLAAIGAVGLVLLSTLRTFERAEDAAVRAQASLSAAQEARYALARQENSLRGYVLSGDIFYVQRIESTHLPAFHRAVAALDRMSAGDPSARAEIARLRSAFDAWRTRAQVPALALAAEPSGQARAAAMIGHDQLADRLMDQVEAALRALEDKARAVADQAGRTKLEAGRQAELALMVGFLAISLVAGALGVLMVGDIGTPITRLTGVMTRLAEGETTVETPYVDRRDEIGRMARALLTFREAAVAKAALERETLDLAQQAQAANRAKSAFLATMAHELRTPLNGILGMAQIMAGHTLSGDQQDRLGVIRSSGQTLLGVINDVLDVSQIEAGRLEIQAAPFDLGRFCDELGALYGALAAEKGLAFSLRAAPASRVWLLGDVVRLRQIAGNLISNALKFTAAGAITVTVDHADGRLSFACADTGVGVPEDRQAQLFERFVQADASLTRRFGGSGLGLAICRDLLTLMGGQIGFESRPGHGSTFHFAAPMPLAPALEAAPAVASPQADPVDSGLRILVADDNATNRLVIESLLDRFMIASESVENGRQAVEAWEAGTFDAILMDIHMPEMDGVAATAAIRRRERETGRPKVPIIAVTASVLAHETEGYIAAGMDGCVAKPIDAQTMLTTLQDLLAA